MDTKANREFMKSVLGTAALGVSDQSMGLPQPPVEVPSDAHAPVVPLPPADPAAIVLPDVFECMRRRRSRRHWKEEPLTPEQLALLLWATQGVEEVLGDGYALLRAVPSGGARHAFETYLAINDVTGIEPGLYRYLSLSHSLVRVRRAENMRDQILEATFGQQFVASAPAVIFWACVPYRGEWRYTTAAHKMMLLDAGHMCQNLYLACESLGLGMCAVGAYDQQALDAFLGLDGHEQFAIYLAPVGKV